MTRVNRERETIRELPDEEALERRRAEGWRPIAIEWQRDGEKEGRADDWVPVPYGFRIAPDGRHLCPDQGEVEAMTLMLDGIVADQPLWKVAEELNRRGLRTRSDEEWTQVAIFDLLPRLVESAPDIFRTETWPDLRKLRPRTVA